jgi:enoyl-CoA hydratase/carnithine racemase
MTTLADYKDRYRNIAVSRGDDGVLEVRLHTDGGPLAWSSSVHRDLPDAFSQISLDPENKVVLLSGTGEAFCDHIDHESFRDIRWETTWSEARHLLQNLVDIEVPVVGVVNGPALIHAELVVLSDIVIAADTAVFADKAHFVNGAVPSDGVHIIWPHLLGANRGRHFLLTGRELSAQDAYDLGLVAEIVTGTAEAYERGLAIGRELATRDRRVLRYTRESFATVWREMLHSSSLSNGLALEGLATDLPR